jgi:hypothetical protein
MSLIRYRRALRRAVTSPGPEPATPCVAGRPAARGPAVPHVAVLVFVVVFVVVLAGLGIDTATAVGTAIAGAELVRRSA